MAISKTAMGLFWTTLFSPRLKKILLEQILVGHILAVHTTHGFKLADVLKSKRLD
jgi:hypothetical protein